MAWRCSRCFAFMLDQYRFCGFCGDNKGVMAKPKQRLSRSQRKERRRQIALLVKQGQKLTEITRIFGVTKTFIYQACKEFDVVPPKDHILLRGTGSLGEGGVFLVLKLLFNPTLSYREIAKSLGITYARVGQIYNYAAKAEIPGLPKRLQGKHAIDSAGG